jgi:hypothetical protein
MQSNGAASGPAFVKPCRAGGASAQRLVRPEIPGRQMTILLDTKPLDTGSLAPEAIVSDALALAKQQLEGSGLVVVGLREGGQEVSADRLAEVCSRQLAGPDDLEIITGRPKQIVLDTMEQVRTAFAGTFAQVKESADALAAGNLSEAMTKLVECVKVWGQTHLSVVQGGLLLGVKFDDVRIGDRTIAACLTSLAERLRELKQAVESHDHVLLGDLLRYEFDEALQGWELMLDGFIAHVRQLDV